MVARLRGPTGASSCRPSMTLCEVETLITVWGTAKFGGGGGLKSNSTSSAQLVVEDVMSGPDRVGQREGMGRA